MGKINERCGGIDIGKLFLFCCALTGAAHEEPRSQTMRFDVTVPGLTRLRDWLIAENVSHVIMESTGSYWIPVFNILEDHFVVVLANPEEVKNRKGHKTDRKDAEHLAELLRHGHIRSSYIPPKPVRELRDLTRRRLQLMRQVEWRKRLVWIGGAYVAILVLLFAYLGLLRFQLGRLDRRIARDTPGTEFVRATEAKWKALAPAIDPHYYPVEILQHLFESLPSADVRITSYNQSARQISVDGEANTAALAYEFIEKIKKNTELRTFQFDMASPRILPNNHAQFRLEGKPK